MKGCQKSTKNLHRSWKCNRLVRFPLYVFFFGRGRPKYLTPPVSLTRVKLTSTGPGINFRWYQVDEHRGWYQRHHNEKTWYKKAYKTQLSTTLRVNIPKWVSILVILHLSLPYCPEKKHEIEIFF